MGGQGAIPPNLAPQQVPGEDIWRLQNVRKRFTGRGSATDPLEKLTALPSPLSWWARRLAVPSPRTHFRSRPFWPRASAHWASPLTRNRRSGPSPTRWAGSAYGFHTHTVETTVADIELHSSRQRTPSKVHTTLNTHPYCGIISCIRWNLLRSTCLPNLKCLASSVTKI